jgi:rfaE bifunctional protein nucleotidyltransferase chain/domain
MSAPEQAPLARLVDREELARHLARERAAGRARRAVLANGCFDLLHAGHLDYLEHAAALGDLLIVALNSDASARALKGSGRPLVPERERARLLLALRCVDWAVVFGEPTLEATLRALRPAVHAKGGDYTPGSVPEREIDRELGIEIAICGGPKRESSSALAARAYRSGHGSEQR